MASGPDVGSLGSASVAEQRTAPPAISIRNVTKRFARRGGAGDVIPVDDVSLDISASEMFVLLGPSGCGKTTLLRCVAGLEVPDAGEIRIRGETVFSAERGIFMRPEDRAIGMVFQSYALWPHMTVFDNVAYPLQAQRVPRSEIRSRVVNLLETMGLGGLEKQYPGQLSGGQQQRAALARALVPENGVLLLDEPLSNVDAKVREQLRVELVAMQRRLNFCALYVTHDQVEAMQLANRIAVLESGRVAQLASPWEVYWSPSSHYVADFVGTLNVWGGSVRETQDGAATVSTPVGDVTVATGVQHTEARGKGWFSDNGVMHQAARRGDAVLVASRPESWSLSAQRQSELNCFEATIEAVLFSGSYQHYLVRCGGTLVTVWSSHVGASWPEGSTVWLSIDSRSMRLLPTE